MNDQVPRFECTTETDGYAGGHGIMKADANGDWVRFEDYERLQRMLQIKEGRIAGLMHDLYGDRAAHEPPADQCEVCTKPLPPVGAWSMPSCPDCQELLEGLGQLMGDFADREQTIKAGWIERAINLICARPSQPPGALHEIPWQKPVADWPDIVAAIRSIYPRDDHKGCGEIALAAATEIEKLRAAQPTVDVLQAHIDYHYSNEAAAEATGAVASERFHRQSAEYLEKIKRGELPGATATKGEG